MPIAADIYKKIVAAKTYIDSIAPSGFRDQTLRKKEAASRQPRSFIPHCFFESCVLDNPSPPASIQKSNSQ